MGISARCKTAQNFGLATGDKYKKSNTHNKKSDSVSVADFVGRYNVYTRNEI